MACNTGRAAQAVVVVDMAIGTLPWWHCVHTGQCKARAGVVEDAIRPEHGVVAGFARGGECSRDMVHGAERGVVVSLVAGHARSVGQVVVVVDVAIGALPRWNCVIPRQRKASRTMIESGIEPG